MFFLVCVSEGGGGGRHGGLPRDIRQEVEPWVSLTLLSLVEGYGGHGKGGVLSIPKPLLRAVDTCLELGRQLLRGAAFSSLILPGGLWTPEPTWPACSGAGGETALSHFLASRGGALGHHSAPAARDPRSVFLLPPWLLFCLPELTHWLFLFCSGSAGNP